MELGSHHSALTTNEKLNRLKNEQLTGSVREGRTQGKWLSPRLEESGRRVWGGVADQSRESQEEATTGVSAR